jgi:peptide-methionine (S)-S-oxide reductase
VSVTNGYAGGETKDPTYDNVCSGQTGHAEVVNVEFDPEQISLETILSIFWASHNPTTLNQQGADIGTQYRSIILYNSAAQLSVIQESQAKVGQPLWKDKIVTELKPLEAFWPAEDYHQNYLQNNPGGYTCHFIRNIPSFLD